MNASIEAPTSAVAPIAPHIHAVGPAKAMDRPPPSKLATREPKRTITVDVPIASPYRIQLMTRHGGLPLMLLPSRAELAPDATIGTAVARSSCEAAQDANVLDSSSFMKAVFHVVVTAITRPA